MDLAITWENLSSQGIMFWSATLAVALGLTLILTAGMIHFRRVRSRSRTPIGNPQVMPEPVFDHAKVAERAKSDPALEKAAAVSAGPNHREWSLLLARLRYAADRLEEFERLRPECPARSHESPLKESRNGVDYLFRAGKG
jgi:hypothetical protein